ncbi:MAG: DUF1735 domain-containing protein [Flavitalea sp.]
MIKKSFKYFAVALVSSIGFLSCEKNDEGSMNGAGRTIVKIDEATEEKYAIALDFINGFQDVNLITVRRNVPNNAELNKPLDVVIMQDAAALTAYNAAHNTNYIPLPVDAYTIDAGNPKTGDDWTLKFAEGEFAKPIRIQLDATKLDLSKQYAFAFKIKDAAGNAISNAFNNVIVEVGVKNKYDGIYEVTGTMVDVVSAALTGYYPLNWDLRTAGASKVKVYDRLTGTQTHLISSGGALSQYGTFGLDVTFDPASDAIASIKSPYEPAANSRAAALDESGENRYDAATKTVKIKYFMLQPALVTPYRTSFDETWVYKSAR